MAKILVIDDDGTTLMFLRHVLEEAGYEFEDAQNGAVGISFTVKASLMW